MYLLCIETTFVLWAQKKFGPSLSSMHRTLKYGVLVWRTLLESRLPINREKFLPPKKVLFPFLSEKDLNWYFLVCTYIQKRLQSNGLTNEIREFPKIESHAFYLVSEPNFSHVRTSFKVLTYDALMSEVDWSAKSFEGHH